MRGIEAVGQRLRAEMGLLYRWLPMEARTTRAMASFLGVDRNTCQRVLAALQTTDTGCDAFVRIPGAKPLQELISQAKLKGAPREMLEGIAAAVQRLLSLLDEFDESQARLKARVEATLAASVRADRSELDLRRSHSDDSARMLGRQMRVFSLTTAVRAHPDDPSKLEQAFVRSLIGLRLRPDAAPLALGLSSTDRQNSEDGKNATLNPLSLQSRPGGRTSGLVESLSSAPLPTLTTRGPSGSLVTVLDPAQANGKEGTDVVVATRVSHIEHPALKPPEVYHTSAMMLTPATRLVFDVFLHRSLAIASVPSVGAFQYTMSMSDDPEENWPFRVPERLRLELLGRGIGQASHESWARQAEATSYLFENTGWDPGDYVGHRLDVQFPIWGAAYYQWFDFRVVPTPEVDRTM